MKRKGMSKRYDYPKMPIYYNQTPCTGGWSVRSTKCLLIRYKLGTFGVANKAQVAKYKKVQ